MQIIFTVSSLLTRVHVLNYNYKGVRLMTGKELPKLLHRHGWKRTVSMAVIMS